MVLLEDILEDPDSSRERLCNDRHDCPIRIVICEKSFLSILDQLRMKCHDAGWTFQTIPCHKLPGNPPMSDSQMQALNTIQPRNPILKIIKKIENAMTTLNCSLHRGNTKDVTGVELFIEERLMLNFSLMKILC